MQPQVPLPWPVFHSLFSFLNRFRCNVGAVVVYDGTIRNDVPRLSKYEEIYRYDSSTSIQKTFSMIRSS